MLESFESQPSFRSAKQTRLIIEPVKWKHFSAVLLSSGLTSLR